MITGQDLRRAREGKGVGLARLATQIGRSKGHLSKVERGVDERPVTPALIRDYERALKVTIRIASVGNEDDTARVVGATDTYRRVPTFLEATARRAAAFAAWAETTNVGPTNLHRFEIETRRLAKAYLSQSPVSVYTQTASLAHAAFDLVQGHQHLSQTRELYVAAGRLSALLSWISGDLGHPAAAAEHARVAWICADQADDPTLRAWAMCVASKAAFWDGDYRSATQYARNGLRYRATGTVLVILACQAADALKNSGEIAVAEQAIAMAHDLREQVATPDEIGGLFSCGVARQTNYAVGVHLAAARARTALTAASEAECALASADQWAYGTWAQIRFGAALAHIMLDNVDGAAESLGPVLAMPPDQHLDTLTRRASEVVHALAPSRLARSSEVRDLVARIEDYRNYRPTVQEITSVRIDPT